MIIVFLVHRGFRHTGKKAKGRPPLSAAEREKKDAEKQEKQVCDCKCHIRMVTGCPNILAKTNTHLDFLCPLELSKKHME